MNKLLFRMAIVFAFVVLPLGLLLFMMIKGAPEYWDELCDFYRQVWPAFRKGGRV